MISSQKIERSEIFDWVISTPANLQKNRGDSNVRVNLQKNHQFLGIFTNVMDFKIRSLNLCLKG